MFKQDEYVVYKKNICKVKEIKENYFKDVSYYILSPIEDGSLTISLPTSNENGILRAIMSKEEVENLINSIPSIETINPESNRPIHYEYKDLIMTGKHEDLIKIIKTAYLRNDAKLNDGKKVGATDTNYLKLAEQSLYNEISIVLGLSYNETKKYVQNKVKELDTDK